MIKNVYFLLGGQRFKSREGRDSNTESRVCTPPERVGYVHFSSQIPAQRVPCPTKKRYHNGRDLKLDYYYYCY